jgi:hypothetical protein
MIFEANRTWRGLRKTGIPDKERAEQECATQKEPKRIPAPHVDP